LEIVKISDIARLQTERDKLDELLSTLKNDFIVNDNNTLKKLSIFIFNGLFNFSYTIEVISNFKN
jgi:hypothetical protein